MEALVTILAVLALTSFLAVLAVRRVLRAVRKQAILVRDRVRLAVRASAGGSLGETARLRRDLLRSVTGVRRAMEVARAVGAPVGDTPSLLARLELAAHEVDGELRILETYPADPRLGARLAGPRSRAQTITDACDELVDGLLSAAGRGATDLSLLQAECSIEADALRGDGRRSSGATGSAAEFPA